MICDLFEPWLYAIFAMRPRSLVLLERYENGLYAVGVIAKVAQVQRFGAGLQLVLGCDARATALRYSEHDGVIFAAAAPLPATNIASAMATTAKTTTPYGTRSSCGRVSGPRAVLVPVARPTTV
jgi:hypothetical protein